MANFVASVVAVMRFQLAVDVFLWLLGPICMTYINSHV